MDSGGRFAKEKDYAEWSDRLHIIGLTPPPPSGPGLTRA